MSGDSGAFGPGKILLSKADGAVTEEAGLDSLFIMKNCCKLLQNRKLFKLTMIGQVNIIL